MMVLKNDISTYLQQKTLLETWLTQTEWLIHGLLLLVLIVVTLTAQELQ
jgi:hypothetical protein